MEEEKLIDSMMDEKRVFYPPEELSKNADIKSLDEYKKIYRRSIEDTEGFWGELEEQLDWYKKWDKVLEEDFKEAKHEWFIGGKLNVRFKAPVRPGDAITVGGKIHKVERGEDKTLINCDVICTNQDGESVIIGETEVRLKNNENSY